MRPNDISRLEWRSRMIAAKVDAWVTDNPAATLPQDWDAALAIARASGGDIDGIKRMIATRRAV